MKKFIDFLNEEAGAYDCVEPNIELTAERIDELNSKLDVLTAKPYQNAPIFLTQLRAAFEMFGINLPSTATEQFLNLDAEIVYDLPNENRYLYIVYNTREDGFVDGYAQVVDEQELSDLSSMTKEDLFGDDEEEVKFPKYPPARRDDDSGNTSEYA